MAIRPEFPGIQYLRGIAALLVLIYHISLQRMAYDATAYAATLRSGVDIFFVISGVVMVYSTSGGKGVTAVDFLRRRIIRIAPLYWLLTLFMVMILVIAPHLAQASQLAWPHMLSSFLFVPALNPATVSSYIPLVTPGWTLNLEMFFYALFAGGIVISRGRTGWLMALVAIPLLLLATTNLFITPKGIFGFYTNPIMLEFLYGMALGFILLRRQPRINLSVGLMMMALLFALLLLPPPGTSMIRPFRFGLLALFIVALSTAIPWPRMALLHRLGDSSYSLYLSHFFVLSAFNQLWRRMNLEQLSIAAPLFYAGATVLALVGGYICWRWVEVPLTQLAIRAFGKRKAIVPPSVRILSEPGGIACAGSGTSA